MIRATNSMKIFDDDDSSDPVLKQWLPRKVLSDRNSFSDASLPLYISSASFAVIFSEVTSIKVFN